MRSELPRQVLAALVRGEAAVQRRVDIRVCDFDQIAPPVVALAKCTLCIMSALLCCKYTRSLGCVVGNGRLSMDPRKVAAVDNLIVGKDVGDIRKFVGMAQFYRRWTRNGNEEGQAV